jgi:hypothetical protein
MNRRVLFLLLAPLALGWGGLTASAQSTQQPTRLPTQLPSRVTARVTPPAAVPFGPGEDLVYDLRLGALGRRGEGRMTLVGLEEIRGKMSYHAYMSIQGGLFWFKVNDQTDSWFDVTNLATRRFVQDVDEPNYERHRDWELYPDERRWERTDNGRSGEMPTDLPLDDLSFFYFVRTLPLQVGDEYTLDRYFKESGNPVVIKVLRNDTVQVPAGTFETVVVQPIIQTDGLFSQGGEAELHFTTDERRLLVYMKSNMNLIGALSLHLREITEGLPVGGGFRGVPLPAEGGVAPVPDTVRDP